AITIVSFIIFFVFYVLLTLLPIIVSFIIFFVFYVLLTLLPISLRSAPITRPSEVTSNNRCPGGAHLSIARRVSAAPFVCRVCWARTARWRLSRPPFVCRVCWARTARWRLSRQGMLASNRTPA
ncbi:hypothetical protein F3A88_24320, partial [Salmonella enterica subsp. enterica serovar Typhi]|nr:hypothetical protein [Salmonella enterica subsp. enterica serovar Typhi]